MVINSVYPVVMGEAKKGVSGGGILPSKISSMDHFYYKDNWASILQKNSILLLS